MSEVIITPEINKIIEESVKIAVQESVKAIEIRNKNEKAQEFNYFKETEKKLYNFKFYCKKVENDQLDLEDIEREFSENQKAANYRSRAKDITSIPNGGIRLEPEEKFLVLIADKKASIERTKREIDKITTALDTIRKDKDFKIIDFKYGLSQDEAGEFIEPLDIGEISERLNMSESTVKRHRRRLIDGLMIAFYGADAISS